MHHGNQMIDPILNEKMTWKKIEAWMHHGNQMSILCLLLGIQSLILYIEQTLCIEIQCWDRWHIKIGVCTKRITVWLFTSTILKFMVKWAQYNIKSKEYKVAV